MTLKNKAVAWAGSVIITTRCGKCGEDKILALFHKNKARKSGVASWCKECLSDPDVKAKKTAYNRSHAAKLSVKKSKLKAKYGLSWEKFQELLEKQNGRCAICLRKPGRRDLAVDHDHSCCPGKISCGDCVRGLLCLDCNYRLLGIICKESTEGKGYAISVLQRAIDYLDR